MTNTFKQNSSKILSIKAIIFDCDGTLVDSEHAHYLSWQHALQKQGGDFSVEEYCGFAGKSSKIIARILPERSYNGAWQPELEEKTGMQHVDSTLPFDMILTNIGISM